MWARWQEGEGEEEEEMPSQSAAQDFIHRQKVYQDNVRLCPPLFLLLPFCLGLACAHAYVWAWAWAWGWARAWLRVLMRGAGRR